MYFLNHQAFTANMVLFKGTELEPSYSVDLILSEFVLKKKLAKKLMLTAVIRIELRSLRIAICKVVTEFRAL